MGEVYPAACFEMGYCCGVAVKFGGGGNRTVRLSVFYGGRAPGAGPRILFNYERNS